MPVMLLANSSRKEERVAEFTAAPWNQVDAAGVRVGQQQQQQQQMLPDRTDQWPDLHQSFDELNCSIEALGIRKWAALRDRGAIIIN